MSTYGVFNVCLTTDSYIHLRQLDETFISTQNYMGLAYFWGQAYKHFLRHMTAKQRKRVHDEWLAKGLDFLGESAEHEVVLDKVLKKKPNSLLSAG